MDVTSSSPALLDLQGEILASPEQYVDSVKSSLQSFGGPNANYDELLVLVPFFTHLESHDMENHNGVVWKLLEHGLLATLLDFTFQTSWTYADPDENKVRESCELVHHLFCAIEYLVNIINMHLQDHFPSASGITAAQFMEALYPREKLSRGVSRLSQDMWRNRASFVNPLQNDPDSELNIAHSTLSCLVGVGHLYGIAFDSYFWHDVSHEAVSLLIHCWIDACCPPTDWRARYLMDLVEPLLQLSTELPVCQKVIRDFTHDVEQAESLLEMCCWNIRRGIIDEELVQHFYLAFDIARYYPKEFKEDLHANWVDLLRSVTRACERQLCSGNEEYALESGVPAGLMVATKLFTPKVFLKSINLRGKGDLADIDLISVVARYTPHAVVHAPFYYFDYISNILGGYSTVAQAYVNAGDTFTLPVLIRTAKNVLPDVLAAVRSIRVTSTEVGKRKKAVLKAWGKYAGVLGYNNGRPGWICSVVWTPRPFPPWQVCASKSCICSERKPCHKLRVCKGCWKVYYCSARCQKLDWRDGHHSVVCSRRGRDQRTDY